MATVRQQPRDFNPRAPRGARPEITAYYATEIDISIHAPLAGRDGADGGGGLMAGKFQSTRPSRGATANVHKNHVHICANTQKKYVFLSNTVCQSA